MSNAWKEQSNSKLLRSVAKVRVDEEELIKGSIQPFSKIMWVQVTGDSVQLRDQERRNTAVIHHRVESIWRRSRLEAICNAFRPHFQNLSGYTNTDITHFRQVLNQSVANSRVDQIGKMILFQFGVQAIAIKPCSHPLNNPKWGSKLQNLLETPKWISHNWFRLSLKRQQMSFLILMLDMISSKFNRKWSHWSYTIVLK